jgi:FtsP/CotA-like multicopper oxidase with cupredoxin domain
VINAASLDCPVQLQVQDHELTIIASDGVPVTPTAVMQLLLSPGIKCVIYITTATGTIFVIICTINIIDTASVAVITANTTAGKTGITVITVQPLRPPLKLLLTLQLILLSGSTVATIINHFNFLYVNSKLKLSP